MSRPNLPRSNEGFSAFLAESPDGDRTRHGLHGAVEHQSNGVFGVFVDHQANRLVQHRAIDQRRADQQITRLNVLHVNSNWTEKRVVAKKTVTREDC